ncbi:MAG: class F420-dependent oxidoreductase [Actinomycetia bacterium]|nr:class F420-dependent oxidoreductase [Actinomycetes bacterium]
MALRIFTEPQQGATYDQLLTFARTSEECGFSAFFRSDHYLRMGTPGPPARTDAMVTLAGLARDTSTIRLGTLVTPVTFRPVGSLPILVAQIDHMSVGRLEIGLGAGWFDAEHEAFGLPYPDIAGRYDLLEDQLGIMHGAWKSPAGAEFAFTGKTCSVQFDADAVRPRQQPHPPIVLGGQGHTRSARLAATYADEYNVSFAPVDNVREVHDRVRSACERAGRDPSELSYSSGQTICCGSNDEEVARRAAAIGREVDELRKNGLAGTPAEILEKLATFADTGVDRFYLQVLDLDDLDHLRLIAEEILPYAAGR